MDSNVYSNVGRNQCQQIDEGYWSGCRDLNPGPRAPQASAPGAYTGNPLWAASRGKSLAQENLPTAMTAAREVRENARSLCSKSV
jgi:hypothetical protein